MEATKQYKYPKSIPVFRFLWNAETIRKNPIPFHKKNFEAIGDTFSVRIGWKKYIILSRDAEFTKQVLQKQHKNFRKSDIQTKYLSKYLGKGLLTSDGEHWFRQRRLIQPAFHKKKLNGLVELIQKTIHLELSEIPTERPIDVFPWMNRLTFNVVATSLFDVSISEVQLVRLQGIIENVQAFVVKELRVPHKKWWYRLSGQMKHHLQLAAESREIIQQIIDNRKCSKNPHHDLLEMLLEARYEDTGEPMSNQQLIDEISILFVAGHETTANALSFTFFLLAKHPRIQQQVFEEVTMVERGFPSAIEKIHQLPYTKAVIEETMRLYPPAWITDRETLRDTRVKDFVLQSKTLIGISFYELHRNTKYWKDPGVFRPERFIHKEQGTQEAYYPFGAGPRMCIGMGFALYEMILTVAFVIHRYVLTTTVSEAGMNPLITLKPKGLEVQFSKR